MAGILLFFGASTGYADHKADLISKLRSPTADERLEAAYELAPLVDEKDLRKLLEGWEESWYENGEKKTRKYPADMLSLVVLLDVWPDAADKIVDDLYKITDKEFAPAIADILWNHRKLSGIDKPGVIAEQVRDDWYANWEPHVPNTYIWRDQLLMIAKRDWLYQRWMADYQHIDKKTVVAIMRGGPLPEDLALNLFNTVWLQYFERSWRTGEYGLPDNFQGSELAHVVWSEAGWVSYADIIAVLCNRKDWFLDNQPKLAKLLRTRIVAAPELKFEVYSHSNQWLTAAINSGNKTRDEMQKFFCGELPNADDVLPIAVLHHPWFDSVRITKDFEVWWAEYVLSTPYEEPDPTFWKFGERRYP